MPQSPMWPSSSTRSAPKARICSRMVRGVGGERDPRIAGRRNDELFRPSENCACDGDREPACLERSGGIRTFVFYPELIEALTRREALDLEERRPTFAQRDGMLIGGQR